MTRLVKLGVHAKWLVTVFIEGFVVNYVCKGWIDKEVKANEQLEPKLRGI